MIDTENLKEVEPLLEIEDSPALRRLIEEVRDNQAGDQTNSYNRVYSRHNR